MTELDKQNEVQNMEMDWNDSIETDSQEYVLLPEGDYNFIVTNFERGRFPGGAKIPPCNKATITIQIAASEGVATLHFDLLLYRTLEWKISSFFRCIGLKKHGEKLVMDWSKVINSYGKCHVKQKTYTNQYGEEKTINDVDKFYDFDPKDYEINEDDLPF